MWYIEELVCIAFALVLRWVAKCRSSTSVFWPCDNTVNAMQ